ncbi:MAG: restriction endonuclease [Planctomycetota bacterium]|nr:restriction endonuclease [Planctomycetota bacterium]
MILLSPSTTFDNTPREIRQVITCVDASKCKTKVSKEKTMKGKRIYDPKALNRQFKTEFAKQDWRESRYKYCITTNRRLLDKTIKLPLAEQREFLKSKGIPEPIESYKQTDFVKDRVAVEVQFGKYAFVAFDLFVKHLLFYSGDIINLGVEILPMKSMSKDPSGGRLLSTGIAYFEGEVYNIMRHGRNSPPVPLLVIGIAP